MEQNVLYIFYFEFFVEFLVNGKGRQGLELYTNCFQSESIVLNLRVKVMVSTNFQGEFALDVAVFYCLA